MNWPPDPPPGSITKIAAWVPVSSVLVTDAVLTRSAMDELYDRWYHPWKYPDRPRWPKKFVLVPWLERLTVWWQERRAEPICECDDVA